MSVSSGSSGHTMYLSNAYTSAISVEFDLIAMSGGNNNKGIPLLNPTNTHQSAYLIAINPSDVQLFDNNGTSTVTKSLSSVLGHYKIEIGANQYTVYKDNTIIGTMNYALSTKGLSLFFGDDGRTCTIKNFEVKPL